MMMTMIMTTTTTTMIDDDDDDDDDDTHHSHCGTTEDLWRANSGEVSHVGQCVDDGHQDDGNPDSLGQVSIATASRD